VERVATRTNHDFRDEPATRKMHSEFARATVEPRHVLSESFDSAEAVAADIVTRREREELVVQRWS
jgi:hypothetical protein